MADRRMIAKIISVSDKVNDLPDIFDMLLFTWMIPHTDDFGRLPGSPSKVKGLVVPNLERVGKAEVKTALEHLQAAGLIHWYEVDGDTVIQIVNFEKHQTGLHKRTRSKFPDPPTDNSSSFLEVPGNSEESPEIPPELKRREEKGTEEKGTEGNGKEQQDSASTLPDDDPLFRPLGTDIDSGSSKPEINLFDIYEREGFGTISPFASDDIQKLEKIYTARWVQEAMKVAVLSGKRKLVYVEGILINWKADGIDNPWEAEKQPSNNGDGNKGNKYNKRSGKPDIPVVQPGSEPGDSGLTDEQYEEMMRFAAEQQALKEQGVPH